MTTIEYTDTFEQLLDALINYLSDYSSEVAVIERIEALLDRFEALVLITLMLQTLPLLY
ncbi:plasmid stabilization protein [Vibrio apostichopi]|uniref:plasmid stabilization protein n=1 Tax=Vibrio apostichopi TaxID=3035453 RepID=UPI002572F31F|nr:plasmid stabilization protein [Vibrio sp. FE10]